VDDSSVSTEPLLRSIRRWLAFACFLLALAVAGIGITAYSVDSYSGGQFLAGIGVILAVATLYHVLRYVIRFVGRTVPEPIDEASREDSSARDRE
jgi:formate hydrogenlyase subunit 3/multisubunit Na+/H+ antiporter MnhD subunit